MAGKTDPQASKAKTLAKIKKLRELKKSKQPSEDEEDGHEETEEEQGEDFLETSLKISKQLEQRAAKPKVVVLDDDEIAEDEDLQKDDQEEAAQEEHVEENVDGEEMQQEEIPVKEEQTQFKKPKKVKRPYRSFTISVGFPDSVVQKCQVLSYLSVI